MIDADVIFLGGMASRLPALQEGQDSKWLFVCANVPPIPSASLLHSPSLLDHGLDRREQGLSLELCQEDTHGHHV